MADDSNDPLISRRELLKRVGIAGAAAAVPIDALAQAHTGAQPLETLTAAEGATLEAIVARLIPTDGNGPGATEARAARYIDRALGGCWPRPRRLPRRSGCARTLRAALTKGAPFAQLSAENQDAVLRDIETERGTGFRRRRRLLQPGARPTRFRARSATLLRRQRELRRLGSDRLPGRAPGRDRQRSAPRRRRRRRRTCRPTTTRCSRRRSRRGHVDADPTMPVDLKRPTSSSSASAPPAAWPRCRSRRRGSRSSASKPAPGSERTTSPPTNCATTSGAGRRPSRRRTARFRRTGRTPRRRTRRGWRFIR